jgi:hypothetical protein
VRSAEELRQRWLDSIPLIMKRTGMYARDGREMETVAGQLLRDLCFLDERDGDYEQAQERLRGYGQLGVHGPFTSMFGSARCCRAEVASVYAELFHGLGYLPVARRIGPGTWRELTAGLRSRFEGRDVRRSEAEAFLGPASLVVEDRVLCYAAEDAAAGWVFIDCWAERTRAYQPGRGNYETAADADPLIRSVRASAGEFEAGLILTMYGKVLRWGSGWWVHHPDPHASPQSQAIAGQLRQIHAADPSRSLSWPPPDHSDRS